MTPTVKAPATTLNRVANQPKTPLHSFRCDDELWEAVKVRARENGETIADVLRRALADYMEVTR